MASESVEERAQELYAALRSTCVVVLEETARIVERDRTLGRISGRQQESLLAQLRALGWRP